jgi:hypothetical protein
MALPTTYTQAAGLLADFFSKIRDAQAPQKFTNQLLKDLGFESSNHRSFIPLLKALGFLTADGAPTQRYHDYRDHTLSKKVMGRAIRDAYSDLFLIKANPTIADKRMIEGKFKSYHNASDQVAGLMTKTFYTLLELADLSNDEASKNLDNKENDVENISGVQETEKNREVKGHGVLGLHYNIQIHLPATKDIEVYNAIFRSLKDHLIE